MIAEKTPLNLRIVYYSSTPLVSFNTSITKQLGEGIAESGRYTGQSALYFVVRWYFYPLNRDG